MGPATGRGAGNRRRETLAPPAAAAGHRDLREGATLCSRGRDRLRPALRGSGLRQGGERADGLAPESSAPRERSGSSRTPSSSCSIARRAWISRSSRGTGASSTCRWSPHCLACGATGSPPSRRMPRRRRPSLASANCGSTPRQIGGRHSTRPRAGGPCRMWPPFRSVRKGPLRSPRSSGTGGFGCPSGSPDGRGGMERARSRRRRADGLRCSSGLWDGEARKI